MHAFFLHVFFIFLGVYPIFSLNISPTLFDLDRLVPLGALEVLHKFKASLSAVTVS